MSVAESSEGGGGQATTLANQPNGAYHTFLSNLFLPKKANHIAS